MERYRSGHNGAVLKTVRVFRLTRVRIRSSPPFKFWDYILDKFYHYDPHNAGVAQW